MTLVSSPPCSAGPFPSKDYATYNELLIDRGDLTPYLKQLKLWANCLDRDNHLKEGRPFVYPTVLFQILALEYNLGKKLRTVEGFARTVCGLLGFPAPRWTTIWYRLQQISLGSLLQQTDHPVPLPTPSPTPIKGAIDSTGLKHGGPGEYLGDKHHLTERKEFIKFHTIVNTYTHQILVSTLTNGYVHDSPYFKGLVTQATHKFQFDTLYGDKAYGGHECFEILSVQGINPGLLTRKNASSRTHGGSFARSRTVWKIKTMGLDAWKKLIEYGKRWAVERSYSIFKMLFGDRCRARKWPYIVQEISLKIEQMNYYLHELYSA